MLSKIMFLREERDLLMEEKIENDQLGKKIAANLESVAKSSELDKFRQFLEEIEQITKLTVSLTIRLSRLSRKMESGSLSKDELVSTILTIFELWGCKVSNICISIQIYLFSVVIR